MPPPPPLACLVFSRGTSIPRVLLRCGTALEGTHPTPHPPTHPHPHTHTPTHTLPTPFLALQVALVGAPNVGKSSLVQLLSSGLPEVQNYPFTTRSIKMGHFYVEGRRHQVSHVW